MKVLANKTMCYVCGGVITRVPVNIGCGLKQDTVLHRHKRCKPGGLRWMEVQSAKPKQDRSEFFEYYFTAYDGLVPIDTKEEEE